MVNVYKVYNEDNTNVVNRILATPTFMESVYPEGNYEYVGVQEEVSLPPVYRSIDKVEAMSLLLAVTGMDMAEELAFRKDPNLELFWIKWREDVQNILYRDHPLTQQILDVLVATGYLSVEQKQEILDLWPTA